MLSSEPEASSVKGAEFSSTCWRLHPTQVNAREDGNLEMVLCWAERVDSLREDDHKASTQNTAARGLSVEGD